MATADVAFRLALAIANVAALSSWIVQWRGLIGSNGVLPAADTLRRIRARTMPPNIDEISVIGTSQYWQGLYASCKSRLRLVPSVFSVFGASDLMLESSFYVGYLSNVFLVLGVKPAFSCFLFAVVWLSFLAISKPWLTLQMDTKLVEVNVLFACTYLFRSYTPSLWVWAMRWLLFRVMVACAAGKYSAGDKSWKSLSQPAMQWHYFTQPLPNALSQRMHFLPTSFHAAEVVTTYVIEGLVPLGYFAASPVARGLAFLITMGFNGAIGMTGNFGHLHLLMGAISVSVLADTDGCGSSTAHGVWGWAALPLDCPPSVSLLHLPLVILMSALGWTFLAAYVAVSLVPLSMTMGGLLSVKDTPPGWEVLQAAYGILSKLHLIGYYSKFSHMTKFRWELQLEGTADRGKKWVPFGYMAKPGGGIESLDETPATLVPGYRPTLDWRLWFVPLAVARTLRRGAPPDPVEAWYRAFEEGVLRGSPAILDLVKVPQELEARARAGMLDGVRTVIYDYRFTEPPGPGIALGGGHGKKSGPLDSKGSTGSDLASADVSRPASWVGIVGPLSDSAGASPAGSDPDAVRTNMATGMNGTATEEGEDEEEFSGIRSFIASRQRLMRPSIADSIEEAAVGTSSAVHGHPTSKQQVSQVRFDENAQSARTDTSRSSRSTSAFMPTPRKGKGKASHSFPAQPLPAPPETPFPVRREYGVVTSTGLTPPRTPARPEGGDMELIPEAWYGDCAWQAGKVWSRRFVSVYDVVARQGITLVKQAGPEQVLGRLAAQPGHNFEGVDDDESSD